MVTISNNARARLSGKTRKGTKLWIMFAVFSYLACFLLLTNYSDLADDEDEVVTRMLRLELDSVRQVLRKSDSAQGTKSGNEAVERQMSKPEENSFDIPSELEPSDKIERDDTDNPLHNIEEDAVDTHLADSFKDFEKTSLQHGNTLNNQKSHKPKVRIPTGECAINLYGLPRSFKHHVLPSLLRNVVNKNKRYHCDYFVHFFNVQEEETKAKTYVDENGETVSNTKRSSTYDRAGNNGGAVHPKDVYLLEEAVRSTYKDTGYIPTIRFLSDTDTDFETQRKDYIAEIVHNKQDVNPYFVKSPSFTDRALLNILKMWHSQDRVWNLMDNSTSDSKKYKRVAMLRLDVIYTYPIDIYMVPKEMDAFAQGLAHAARRDIGSDGKEVEYFFDYEDRERDYAVIPGFKAYPVNDRYFAGSFEATKIWAKDRFARAKEHVTNVLPVLEYARIESKKHHEKDPNIFLNTKMTDYGLHDEIFVGHTILPAIKELAHPPVDIIVDRELYFVRVRADGAILLKDKPGKGQVQKVSLESALGRKCTGKKFEVIDKILGDRSPSRWQIYCPP